MSALALKHATFGRVMYRGAMRACVIQNHTLTDTTIVVRIMGTQSYVACKVGEVYEY